MVLLMIHPMFYSLHNQGHGTPLAGHDNHAGLMNLEQMDVLEMRYQIPEGLRPAYDNLLIEPKQQKNSAYKPHLIRDHLRKMNPQK